MYFNFLDSKFLFVLELLILVFSIIGLINPKLLVWQKRKGEPVNVKGSRIICAVLVVLSVASIICRFLGI